MLQQPNVGTACLKVHHSIHSYEHSEYAGQTSMWCVNQKHAPAPLNTHRLLIGCLIGWCLSMFWLIRQSTCTCFGVAVTRFGLCSLRPIMPVCVDLHRNDNCMSSGRLRRAVKISEAQLERAYISVRVRVMLDWQLCELASKMSAAALLVAEAARAT